MIPSCFDFEGGTALVSGFEEESPGTWRRTYYDVPIATVLRDDGSYLRQI